jgi:hypothetical protein
MSRSNQILAGILIVQLIVVGVVFWPRAVPSETGESLVSGVEADRIVGLTITDAAGTTLQLAKQAEGWVLPEADDYPCQDDLVPPLLTQLVGLKTDRLVAQTGSSHARLKVAADDFERRLDLELADGTQQRLFVGTSPSYGATHVRLDGQDEVYLTSGLSTADVATSPTSWVDRIYFQVSQEQAVAITLENANGRFEFRRVAGEGDTETGGTWMMADVAPDETLDQGTVQTMVNRATSVSMARPLGKTEEAAYGMEMPSAVVTLRTHSDEEGDKTFTLRVGAKNLEDNTYVVISSESPYYVRVNEFAVQALVENAREDFLVPPPTPTPEPEATPEATPQG